MASQKGKESSLILTDDETDNRGCQDFKILNYYKILRYDDYSRLSSYLTVLSLAQRGESQSKCVHLFRCRDNVKRVVCTAWGYGRLGKHKWEAEENGGFCHVRG